MKFLEILYESLGLPTTLNRRIEAIRHANDDNYNGGGLICCQHFSPHEILGSGRRCKLIEGSVPSVFLVEMIEVSEDMEIMCESCEGLKAEIVALKAKLSKMTLDNAIQELKLLKKTKRLNPN